MNEMVSTWNPQPKIDVPPNNGCEAGIPSRCAMHACFWLHVAAPSTTPRLLLEYYREKDVVVLVTKSVAGTK